MDSNVIGKIQALRMMSVAELQAEWLRLYGEPTRSRNRNYLWKRLAWRTQELAYGGLSNAAKARIDELATGGFSRARTPPQASVASLGAPEIDTATTPMSQRDPRLPAVGTMIRKRYKNRELHVVVREDGLELDGVIHSSATALARAVSGSKSINGWLFLGVTKRKR